jgi:predicted DNA-binding transcriptional regulator AlpA
LENLMAATTKTMRLGDKLTVADICADLGISRRTFYEWRAKGRAPAPLPIAQRRAAHPPL